MLAVGDVVSIAGLVGRVARVDGRRALVRGRDHGGPDFWVAELADVVEVTFADNDNEGNEVNR